MPTKHNLLAVILGGGAGTRLFPLTQQRSKPAVPLGGKYRLVDIAISNCINSDVFKMFVLTQYNSASLNRHLAQTYRFSAFSNGFVEVMAAEQTPESPQWFQGTADAVRQVLPHIRDWGIDTLLILSGDHLYRMDYRLFLQRHYDSNADVTVSVTPCDEAAAMDFGLLKTDESGRIIEFKEKPKGDELQSMRVDTTRLGLSEAEAAARPYLASMGIYVFKYDRLEQLLADDPNAVDFGKEIIPSAINTGNVQGNVSGRSGIVSGSVGGGYYRTDGISALTDNSERDSYKNASANAKLKFAFSDNLSLDLRGYYNRGTVQYDDQFAFGPLTDPRTRTTQYIGYAGLNASLLDGSLRNRLSYSRTNISRIGTDTAVPVSFNVNSLRGTIDRFEYHGAFDVIDAVTLVFGVEHERTFARTFFPANGPLPDVAKTTVTSGFGQVIVKPLRGLTVTGGARYDDYNAYGGVTTFGANFAYTPNGGNTLIRGTYAEGFRAPTLTEALLPFGNTALKPETAMSFDLGVEQKLLDGAVLASATYFHRTSKNAILFSFDTFQSENIEQTRSKGVELGLALHPTSALSINAQYSLVNARDLSPGVAFGARLARRPKDSASVAIDWKSPWGVSLGSTVTLTGDSFDALPNVFSPNPARNDGFALVGVRAAYAINDRIELFGRLENAFDERYATVRGYGALGRNAYAGIRAKF